MAVTRELNIDKLFWCVFRSCVQEVQQGNDNEGGEKKKEGIEDFSSLITVLFDLCSAFALLCLLLYDPRSIQKTRRNHLLHRLKSVQYLR